MLSAGVVKSECTIHVEAGNAFDFRRQFRESLVWYVQVLIFFLAHPAQGVGENHAITPILCRVFPGTV